MKQYFIYGFPYALFLFILPCKFLTIMSNPNADDMTCYFEFVINIITCQSRMLDVLSSRPSTCFKLEWERIIFTFTPLDNLPFEVKPRICSQRYSMKK